MAEYLVDYAADVDLVTRTGLSTLPGGHLTSAGERIGLYGQSDINCGIWTVVTPGAWTRATDFDSSSEVVYNAKIYPQNSDGSDGAQEGSEFYVATTGTITPGSTAFSIAQRSYGVVQTPGSGLIKVNNDWQQASTGVIPGTYTEVTVDSRGHIKSGSDISLFSTFMEGLRIWWDSATQLRVEEGAAYINDPGTVIDNPADITIASPTLTANTWYYVYAYDSGGGMAVEVSDVDPAITYRGRAREKGNPIADPTRRFLGTIRSGSSSNTIRSFYRSGTGWVHWQEGTSATPFRVLSLGTQATTFSSSISASAVVPSTVRIGLIQVRCGSLASEFTNNGTDIQLRVSANADVVVPFVLTGSQSFQYRHPGGTPSPGTSVDVLGYLEPLA